MAYFLSGAPTRVPPLTDLRPAEPRYWLHVGHAREAIVAFGEAAASNAKASDTVKAFPILMHPELPDAIASVPLGDHSIPRDFADSVHSMQQQMLDVVPAFTGFLYHACAWVLLTEDAGDRTLNAATTIRLVSMAQELLPRSSHHWTTSTLTEARAWARIADLFDEGSAWDGLSEFGVTLDYCLRQSVRASEKGLKGPFSPFAPPAQLLGAAARAEFRLAKLGVDETTHEAEAQRLSAAAAAADDCVPISHPDGTYSDAEISLMRGQLAKIGCRIEVEPGAQKILIIGNYAALAKLNYPPDS